jgi:hypothetical protein
MLTSKSFDPSKASIKRDAVKIEIYFIKQFGKAQLSGRLERTLTGSVSDPDSGFGAF